MQPKESKNYTHFLLSMFKSGLRIVSCAFLGTGRLEWAAGILGAAELVGILEEVF